MWIVRTITLHPIAVAAPTVARTFRHWIYQLGGLGFIPLGLLDNSIIPLPGSMDVLTIFLAARHADWWPYYAAMATVGSVIGGFITYRLAHKGGKETLASKFPRRKLEKVYQSFERWGFGAIAIPALLPPPMPMLPFLFAAGAMQYPLKKFLIALALGRMVRYSVLAFLAARYGRHIFSSIARSRHAALWIVLGAVAILAVILAAVFAARRQQGSQA